MITEADVRQYLQVATSSEDIELAIAVVEKLQSIELAECHAFNAALIAAAITQARTRERSTPNIEAPETDGRQLLHRALQRSLRLPR